MSEERIPIEEAAKCPKCDVPGEISGVARNHPRRGEDTVTYECTTELCPWYRTGWVVTSDEHGVVPLREIGPRGMDKDFQRVSPDQLALGRAVMEEIAQRELEVERDPRPRDAKRTD